MLDTDLAQRLGYASVDELRRLIVRHREELETFGVLRQIDGKPGPNGGRPPRFFYLNEEQAMDACSLSRTEAGRKFRAELIRVFTAWRRGELEQTAPTPALPDFSNPVLAARAWADEYEADTLKHTLGINPSSRKAGAGLETTPGARSLAGDYF